MADALIPLAALALGVLVSLSAYLVFEWPRERARARLLADREDILMELAQARALITQQRTDIAERHLRLEQLDRALATATADAARSRSLAEASRAALAEIGAQADDLAAAKEAARAAQILDLSAEGLSRRKIERAVFGYIGGHAHDRVAKTLRQDSVERQQCRTAIDRPVTQVAV